MVSPVLPPGDLLLERLARIVGHRIGPIYFFLEKMKCVAYVYTDILGRYSRVGAQAAGRLP